jgi:hypothetical protein
LKIFQTLQLNPIKLHKLKRKNIFKSLNNYMHVMQLNLFFTIILETKVNFSHIRQVAKWGFSCSNTCCPNPMIVANSKHNWENELFHTLKPMEHLFKNVYVHHVVSVPMWCPIISPKINTCKILIDLHMYKF